MRVTVAIVSFLGSVLLLGCMGSKTDTATPIEKWKKQISSEIPVGTEVGTAKDWFLKKGLRPIDKPLETKTLEVYLETVSATEWFCDKWMVRVVIPVSSDGKVAGYNFGVLGSCL